MLSKEELLKKVVEFLGDMGRDAYNAIIDKEVDDALAREAKRGIKRATQILFETKVKEEVIINLLCDCWQISESSAREAIRVEKTVNSPTKALIDYLKGDGYKTQDVKNFIESNNVKQLLENNPTLWKLSPEKLMKVIEENK